MSEIITPQSTEEPKVPPAIPAKPVMLKPNPMFLLRHEGIKGLEYGVSFIVHGRDKHSSKALRRCEESGTMTWWPGDVSISPLPEDNTNPVCAICAYDPKSKLFSEWSEWSEPVSNG